MKKIVCPINPKTKEKFECQDCKCRDACIEDIYDDQREKNMRGWARTERNIEKLLKEKRGVE
uniref:Uncharacterized protein n=1 Tax=viral metagenome TaxID=1070528 RepID=A0A6M3LHY3_9ZZZZ